MLRISVSPSQALRYAPHRCSGGVAGWPGRRNGIDSKDVRRAEALEQIERSMGRIGRSGSSVMAARRRADRAGVDVSAPGMGHAGRARARRRPAGVGGGPAGGHGGAAGQPGAAPARGQGFVTRSADGSDGRAVVVAITAKGRDAYRRLRAASVAAAGDALAGWKASELTELARLLSRLADDFSAARP